MLPLICFVTENKRRSNELDGRRNFADAGHAESARVDPESGISNVDHLPVAGVAVVAAVESCRPFAYNRQPALAAAEQRFRLW